MILGHSELRKLIKKCNLVTNLSEREMNDPEGCGTFSGSICRRG